MKINLSMILVKLLIIVQYINLVADLLPSYTQIILFLLFFLSLYKNKEVLTEGFKISILSFIIFIVVLLRCMIAERIDTTYYSPFQNVIARYQFLIYPFIFCYINKLDYRSKKSIFKISFFSIIITIIISFYYMIFIDPQAVRNTQGVNYLGVGDFQLMYAIAILIGPLFMLISERKKGGKKSIFLFIILILMIFCLILCNLVTTLVIATLSIGLSLYLQHTSKMKYIILCIISFAAVIIKSIIVNFLNFLVSSQIFYWSTSNKIQAIANVLSGDFTNIDTLSRRMMLINQSLTSFMEHPLWGINFKDHVMGKVGCHSQWADDLARYGIIGNIVIFLNYIKIAKHTTYSCKSNITRKSMKCVWITTFILGFLNPCLSGTILMAIFVVIPTFDYAIKEENNESISC